MKHVAVCAIVVAVFMAGCSGAPSQGAASESSGPNTSETPSAQTSETPSANTTGTPGPNGADLQVARVVERRGARLDAAAARLFRGGADPAAPGWRKSASTRNDIAAGMVQDAGALGSELNGLTPQVQVSTAVSRWGVYAFYQFGLCGRQAAAYFSEAASGSSAEAFGVRARKTCNVARKAYAKAKRKAKAMPRAAATQSNPSAS